MGSTFLGFMPSVVGTRPPAERAPEAANAGATPVPGTTPGRTPAELPAGAPTATGSGSGKEGEVLAAWHQERGGAAQAG
ncbi:MAG TPA: hypothetical protein VF794_33330 [Archangium sp.]|uniref:hypothetical protein n=1 Tax=Archangium sp. TaxID=1872627 RepID=UPI002ED9E13E